MLEDELRCSQRLDQANCRVACWWPYRTRTGEQRTWHIVCRLSAVVSVAECSYYICLLTQLFCLLREFYCMRCACCYYCCVLLPGVRLANCLCNAQTLSQLFTYLSCAMQEVYLELFQRLCQTTVDKRLIVIYYCRPVCWLQFRWMVVDEGVLQVCGALRVTSTLSFRYV